MRLATPRLVVPAFVLTLVIAGCGGGQVTVKEVPGGPVQMNVPGNAQALAPQATATATAEATETPAADTGEATATPQADASSADATATPDNEAGGNAAPGTDEGAAPAETPPAGSDAQQFETFCAENPGAC